MTAIHAASQPDGAKLRWTSDREPGYRRRRRGTGFEYRDAEGTQIRDAAQLARIRALAIPPAWQAVWICPTADGHLQATGRDARGRKQYLYHGTWQQRRQQRKFERLLRVGEALPRVRQRVLRTLSGRSEPTRARVMAALVRLLDTTWLRIGNVGYARQNGSFGLSTLRRRHAELRGDAIELSFAGKGGVHQHARLADPRVARVLRRCGELPGRELFHYRDDDGSVHRIDSADVNDWLAHTAGTRFTAKDFRTWHASVLALDLTLQACRQDAAACRASDVPAEVAQRLGNTPAICRKAYIHPRVLALGAAVGDAAARAELRDQRWATAPRARRGLCAAERRMMAFLAKA